MSSPAILFLIFNRPDTTTQVFDVIRKARPARLYVAGDGSRSDRPGEAQLCEESRQIATAVDWPCQLETLFRSENLGCRDAVSTAISWFFAREPEGIILEDDCVPSLCFFDLCGELLERFRDDKRVMAITGNNFQDSMGEYPYSYYFSRYPHVWGWASWRRAWEMYDIALNQLQEFEATGELNDVANIPGFGRYWTVIFKSVRQRQIDTWDYQWLFSVWAQHGLTCTPRLNLVSNIGFGHNATHTLDANDKSARRPAGTLQFPLSHPNVVVRHFIFDTFVEKTHFGITAATSRAIWTRFIRKIRDIVNSSFQLAVFDWFRKTFR